MRSLKLAKILLVAAFFAIAAVAILPSKATIAAPDKTQKHKKAPVNPDDYVGNESCGACHTNEAAHYSLSAHRKTQSDKFPVDERGCEACHGGAAKHVDLHKAVAKLYEEGKPEEAEDLYKDTARVEAAKLRKFKELSAAQVNDVCLQCHEGEQGRSEERFNFRRSEHHRAGLSCIDCHAPHAPKKTEFLLRDTQPSLCYTCHADQKVAFSRRFHHKVPEGTMKCSDCHNQHGGFQAKQLRAGLGTDAVCLKCHGDKAGPFVFEHAPVKIEGCQLCHMPHGSNNPRMLIRSDIRFLCLECHSNVQGLPGESTGSVGPPTPSFHNLATPRFQNCTVCHMAIHGSNTSRVYFR